MTEADPEDWNLRGGPLNQIKANARVVRGARPGREHDRIRFARQRVLDANLIVAIDGHLRPQATKVVDKVEREAVVVIDQQDHGAIFAPWVLLGEGPGGKSRSINGHGHARVGGPDGPAIAPDAPTTQTVALPRQHETAPWPC